MLSNQTDSSLQMPVICVVGPTASGKSALAQELALEINAEIVSADSMQIYRGMDIGTGKVEPNQRKVEHWGIDLVDPGEAYSVSLFQTYAREAFEKISDAGKRVVLCGGTGFYVRAAIDDYEFPNGEQIENSVRDYFTAYAKNKGAQALWELLNKTDAESAALIHPNNVRRVVRAFELLEEGTSYARQHENLRQIQQVIPAIFIGLEVEPTILNVRIDERVDEMMEQGLEREVRSLLDQGFREGITAPQAIGYKELVAAIEGKISFDEAIEAIKIATHRYGKRQRTWFRKDTRIQWLHADSGDTTLLLEKALELVDTIER